VFDLNWFDCRTQSVDWFRLGSIEFPNVRLTIPGTCHWLDPNAKDRLSERTVLRSHLNRFIVFDILFFGSRVLLRFISLTSPWWDQFWATTKREWETREDKHCKHALFRVFPHPHYLPQRTASSSLPLRISQEMMPLYMNHYLRKTVRNEPMISRRISNRSNTQTGSLLADRIRLIPRNPGTLAFPPLPLPP